MRIESKEMCPVLLLQFREAYERSHSGEIIEVRTPWAAAVDAFRELSLALGSEFLGFEREGEEYVIRVRVIKDNDKK